MRLSISQESLKSYVEAQVATFFPDGVKVFDGAIGADVLGTALERVEECFSHVLLRGYREEGEARFNHLHSDQYSQFLYILSNELWHRTGNVEACGKLLYLNRALHGIFVSFKLDLPEHFLFGHPLGTVLGNACYGDCFVVFQGVTVNTGKDGTDERLPVIGKGCFMGAGSKIIGLQPIGDRASIGVNAFIHNEPVPNDCVAKCVKGKTVIERRRHDRCFAQNYFDIDLG